MKSIIVAYGMNREIGSQGKLLWNISDMREDMENFKAITNGQTVIMGSKTYESIGKPLKNRLNIVVSRDDIAIEGVKIAHSIQEAYDMSGKDAFIIGGGEIFKQTINDVGRIYATEILANFPEVDVFFPKLDESWRVISSRDGVIDENNILPHRFVVYERKV